jgi:type VI secretion system protein ImpA
VAAAWVDVEELLRQTPQAPPCGPELGYDPAFSSIEQSASRIPGRELGEHKTDPQEPKWPQVLDLSIGFLARSKDLRIAIYLVRALVHKAGVPALAEGLAFLHGLLERYWPDLHPLIEKDGDAIARLNALLPLASPEALLADLRASNLLASTSHGQLRVREVEAALGRLPGVPRRSLDEIRAQVAAAVASGDTCREGLAAALESLRSIRMLLLDKVGVEAAPDLLPLAEMLAALKGVCDAAVRGTEAGPQSTDKVEGSSPAQRVASDGVIRSREEALKLLDRVCEYLEGHEPANPAPLLIRRAQRLMRKNFMEIVQDLLPDSVSQVQHLAGVTKE